MWAKEWAPRLVNYVPAVAYHYLIQLAWKILAAWGPLFNPDVYKQIFSFIQLFLSRSKLYYPQATSYLCDQYYTLTSTLLIQWLNFIGTDQKRYAAIWTNMQSCTKYTNEHFRLGNPTCYRAGAYDVQKSVHFLDPTSTQSAFGSGVLGLGNGLDNMVKQDTGKLRQNRLAFSKSGRNLTKPSSSYFCAKSTV